MTWSYSLSNLSPPSGVANKDQVRLLIGDTISTAPIFQDEELGQFLVLRPSMYGAAQLACTAAAAKYSAQVNEAAGDRKKEFSDLAKAFRAAAAQYGMLASVAGGGAPYSGGISISDKLIDRQNSDSVQPAFQEGMDDNPLPVGPAGPIGVDYGGQSAT